MDEQMPQKKSHTRLILIALAVFGLLAILCCGGVMFVGYRTATTMEKTYYPECETLDDNGACSACCKKHGHNGNVTGNLLNDDGKECGCF